MLVVLKSVQRRTAPKTERNGFGQVKALESTSKPVTFRFPCSETLIAEAAHFHRHRLGQLARKIIHMHARAAVNVRRIFVGEQTNLHGRL